MIYVKGTKWIFKKQEDNTYKVKPLTKGVGLRTFIYTPKENFSCSKLKRHIRKHLVRLEKNK